MLRVPCLLGSTVGSGGIPPPDTPPGRSIMLFARQSLLSDQQGHFGSSENLAQVAQVFRLKRITSTVQARWSLLYRYIQSVGSGANFPSRSS